MKDKPFKYVTGKKYLFRLKNEKLMDDTAMGVTDNGRYVKFHEYKDGVMQECWYIATGITCLGEVV